MARTKSWLDHRHKAPHPSLGPAGLVYLDTIPDVKALHWPRRDDYATFSATNTLHLPNDAHQSNTFPSSFLQLPRELRDMIYAYFLTAHRPPSSSPFLSGPRIFREADEDDFYEPEDGLRDNIAYPVSIAQTDVDALLRTNRVIRAEILELADKRNRTAGCLSAELDLMASGSRMFPLWTRLPVLVGHETPLDVTVNLRVFSPDAFVVSGGALQPDNLCPAVYTLLTLLNQFVTCGPAFTRFDGLADRVTVIGTLTLRISNNDIYTSRTYEGTVHQMVRMCKALSRCRNERAPLRRVCVVEEDEDLRSRGAEREWRYDVVTSCTEEEDRARKSAWKILAVALKPEIARLSSVKKCTREEPAWC